jgi:DNA-binding NarL/FixJ family response regulator
VPRAENAVLILTTFDLDEYVYDALRGGASGLLLKDVPAHQTGRRNTHGRRGRRFTGT